MTAQSAIQQKSDLVSIRDLVKHFPIEDSDDLVRAVDGVSFAARLGETIAFAGPSGSGKSTLVKLLVGLYRPSGGRILFNGVDYVSLRLNPTRRQFGFVTQETQLFSGTVRHNLLLGRPEASDAEVWEALALAHAEDFVRALPDGLDEPVGERGSRRRDRRRWQHSRYGYTRRSASSGPHRWSAGVGQEHCGRVTCQDTWSSIDRPGCCDRASSKRHWLTCQRRRH